MEGFALPNEVKVKQNVTDKEITDAFVEGDPALYMVIQLVCPECNKLVRVSLLTGGKNSS